jgi:glutamine amidotransferase
LFTASEEFGDGRGLDVIPGVVRRFPPGRKIPHMGWNQVSHGGRMRLFDGIAEGSYFYFVHSFYPVVAGTASTAYTEGGLPQGAGAPDVVTDRGGDGLRVAWCDYGIRFAAAVERGPIWATQFHPEKSQRWGLQLLENFAALVRGPALERRQVPPGAGHPRMAPASRSPLQ